MARLRITVWPSNGGSPKVRACPSTAALVNALSARSRTDVTLVHGTDETPRKPTPWEAKASIRLATRAAAKILPAVVVASALPEDLDSDLVAVAVPKESLTPRHDLIQRAEAALSRLPADATPIAMGRIALAFLGPANATARRGFLEVLGMSGPDAREVVKALYPPRRKPNVHQASAEPEGGRSGADNLEHRGE